MQVNVCIYVIINPIINIIKAIPTFNFTSKAAKNLAKKYAAKLEEKAAKVVPTPFSLDFEEVEKQIILTLKDNKEQEFYSTAKNIKVGNFCIVLQKIASVFPMWYSKSSTSALLVMFIIKHMKMGTNIIEIKEEDFCTYSNCSPRAFYNAIDAVIRPECNHPCTGDTLALLARTTKKGIYVVNHNFIYRGNYDEFVTIYEEKFPNGCKLDNKGRVILD